MSETVYRNSLILGEDAAKKVAAVQYETELFPIEFTNYPTILKRNLYSD